MTRARIFSQSGGSAANGGGSANVTFASVQPFLTTANVVELANLYFTNTRVFANLQLASLNDFRDVNTTNKSNGQVLLWDGNIWLPGNVASAILNTDYLPEGTSNLYYTNARARTAFTAGNPTIIIDWALGTITANLSAVSGAANTTDGVNEGFVNKYFSNARAFANLQLASLNDLYDVQFSALANNDTLKYNIDSGKWINAGPVGTTAFFAQYAGEANIALSIGNHLTDNLPEGNAKFLTPQNLANLLANVSIDALLDVNTRGTVSVNYVLAWNGNVWAPTAISTVTGGFSQNANIANLVLTLSNFTTANLSESSSNLYFTTARANAAIYPSLTTANVIELSSNLYFTNARAVTAVRPLLTTANVYELEGNLYYTNSRVVSAVTPLLTTANVVERTNLYFTNARVMTAIDTADLTTTKNIQVTGNVLVNGIHPHSYVALQVSNVQITSKTITIARDAANPAGAEGAGLFINGANARITYNESGDAISVNKNLIISGNILPGISGTFSIGSPTRKFRDLYLGTTTLYLGDTAISIAPDGKLKVTDVTGQPTNIDFGNVTSTQSVTVDRIFNSAEINSYIGANVSQFLSNTTANLYLGIKKNNDLNKFAGIRIVEQRDTSGNVSSDVIIYNDKENTNGSTARLSILGTGNVNINAESFIYGNLDVRNRITTDRVIFANTNHTLKVYQYYNESTQSLDTIFL
jgi:hypothetical protein